MGTVRLFTAIELDERVKDDLIRLQESLGRYGRVVRGVKREQIKGLTLYRAAGCPKCFHTGYKGRVGIFEIMQMNRKLKSMILQTYDAQQIMSEALKGGTVSLRQDGIRKVVDGVSTIEEVIRVTQQI